MQNSHSLEIFLDDTDRDRFLELLGTVVERFDWICHAYCLMTNHYHLLIETPRPNLSKGMKHLNGVYTQWFNRQHSRAGHLVQGRFKSILVEKESYLLELARYIALNPVRAQMTRNAGDWPWSSYQATAGLIDTPDFLTVDWLLSQFDKNPEAATNAYETFIRQGRGIDIWGNLRAGLLLGDEDFVESIKPMLKDAAANHEFRRKERLVARPTLEELFANVTDKPTRNKGIYSAVREHEYKLKDVGDFLGLAYPTISVIAKRVAEERGSNE